MPFPVSEAFVHRAEQALGVVFPPEYVAALVTLNGGVVSAMEDDWFLYPVLDDSNRKRLSRTCNDVIRETKASRQWSGFPPDAIAIGENGAGDRLIFLASEHSTAVLAPSVFIWLHETAEVLPAAASFSLLQRA